MKCSCYVDLCSVALVAVISEMLFTDFVYAYANRERHTDAVVDTKCIILFRGGCTITFVSWISSDTFLHTLCLKVCAIPECCKAFKFKSRIVRERFSRIYERATRIRIAQFTHMRCSQILYCSHVHFPCEQLLAYRVGWVDRAVDCHAEYDRDNLPSV